MAAMVARLRRPNGVNPVAFSASTGVTLAGLLLQSALSVAALCVCMCVRPSAEFLQVSLCNQPFHVSLPDVELAVLCQSDRPAGYRVGQPRLLRIRRRATCPYSV